MRGVLSQFFELERLCSTRRGPILIAPERDVRKTFRLIGERNLHIIASSLVTVETTIGLPSFTRRRLGARGSAHRKSLRAVLYGGVRVRPLALSIYLPRLEEIPMALIDHIRCLYLGVF